jgi:hypothetical protein
VTVPYRSTSCVDLSLYGCIEYLAYLSQPKIKHKSIPNTPRKVYFTSITCPWVCTGGNNLSFGGVSRLGGLKPCRLLESSIHCFHSSTFRGFPTYRFGCSFEYTEYNLIVGEEYVSTGISYFRTLHVATMTGPFGALLYIHTKSLRGFWSLVMSAS